jgi:hypothetical protein
MTAFAMSVAEQAARASEQQFAKVMQRAVLHAENALADTPKQLDVLRKAGVVDAGAMGFTELVAGMSDYLDSGKIMQLPDMSVLHDIEPAVDSVDSDNASQFRFCTECIVTGTDIDRRKLREALAILGDSIVLAGTKRKAKIHIHADDPDTVFAAARQHGAVSAEKADDMHRQQHSTRERSHRFAVITDSAADILDEDIERLDIHMVPCRIQFGDRGYLDKVSITNPLPEIFVASFNFSRAISPTSCRSTSRLPQVEPVRVHALRRSAPGLRATYTLSTLATRR